ncbi:hypothetical protein ACLHDG_09005 [Sulfurovum sp. CS9]|uniref:hypothetical protein n=1 Tax=Sulfurovum sp. CS9 TaxID=3391146 RepID=UPI0039EBDCBE
MKNLVNSKTKTETLRAGTVRTTYTWDGKSKKPRVTYSHAAHVVPEEGTLDTVINRVDDTKVQVEPESPTVSHIAKGNTLLFCTILKVQ